MAKKFSRLAKLSGLTSKVSSTYIAQRIKGVFQSEEDNDFAVRKLHVENAERIADAMSTLKGAAMKVGQSMAVLADSMDLPDEISKKFTVLQDKATPVPFATIEQTLEAEYEGKQEDYFSRIDPEPLGTASLAQAHAAWLKDGRPVVIKVLHEGVEASVDTDLIALKTILITGRVLKRSREEIDVIFEEIRCRLLEELDYEKEAENLRKFYQFFEGNPNVVIPQPIDFLSTKRILVMDRISGKNLDQFVASATPETMQKAGDNLVFIFHEMAYVFRAIHADPHGGNFLFQKDGSIGLLDFGCVKRLPLQFMALYAKIANSIVDKDEKNVLKIANQIGVLNQASLEAQQAFLAFAVVMGEPFQVQEYHSGSEQDRLMEKTKVVSAKVLKYPEIRSPKDIIFLHRALTGIYSMLCKLRHKGRYEEIRRHYANTVIAVAEGKAEDQGWR